MPEERRRILSFDLLRESAVFYIIFVWHIQEYAGRILLSPIAETLMYSSLSILVFISGFVLTLKYDHFSNIREAAVFFKKRILKVYPLYFFALILFYFSSLATYEQMISGIFLVNSLFNTHLRTLWFVTMIVLYYVMLAVLLHTYSIKRTLIISSAFFFCCILLHAVFDLIEIRFIYYFFSFAAGIISAKHASIFNLIKSKRAALASLLIIMAFTYMPNFLQLELYDHLCNIIFILFSIPPLIAASNLVCRKINKYIILKLSYVSYCMYIFHRIVYWMLLEIYMPGTDILIVAYLFFAGFPALYFISFSLQSGYDFLFRKEGLKDFNLLPQRIGFYRIIAIGLFLSVYIYLI